MVLRDRDPNVMARMIFDRLNDRCRFYGRKLKGYAVVEYGKTDEIIICAVTDNDALERFLLSARYSKENTPLLIAAIEIEAAQRGYENHQ